MPMDKEKLKIIIGMKPKSKPIEDDSMEDNGDSEDSSESESDERVSAAQDIIDAIKSGDAEALDYALEEHYKYCK